MVSSLSIEKLKRDEYRRGLEDAAKLCIDARAERCRWIEERPRGKHVDGWMAERDALQAIASAIRCLGHLGQDVTDG